MAPVIGIDLGTTNTVVAVVKDGHASAIPDESGQALIPSVVSFHPNGTVLVGRAAKPRRIIDTHNTIYSVKRLIGRSWDSEEVRRARARFPFEMREGPGQAALVVARGEAYTLPEISAFVLRKARSLAEASLGTPIERAVVTVPANFNDLQRAATKVAGRVAGLEVLRILNEPTAAALAYGYGKSSSERLAVYDFGGGTFDITLLDLSDNVFEVLATAGNTFLGGDDIDLLLADRMAAEFLARHRLDPRTEPQAFEKLRAAAEQLKQKLSFDTHASLSIEELAHGPGGRALGFTFGMTRADFERMAAPVVDRTFDVCREALAIARVNAQQFDEVLLVGGSTRMPLVRQRVEEFFNREVKAHLSPDEVVAIGAAIQANALAGSERQRPFVPPPPAAARRVPTLTSPSSTLPLSSRARAPIRAVTEPALPAARAPREESVAFALDDQDIEEILGPAPPHAAPTRAAQPALATSAVYGEDDITKRGRVAADFSDDEPTQTGRVAPATLALATAPALGVTAPLAPAAAYQPPAGLGHPDLEIPRSVSMPPSARPSVPPARVQVPPPLLIDVTPFALCVETVQGFCDAIIQRNTQVPCEQTRTFVTAADGQIVVRVRVAQGESRRFDENTHLGEVELSGLAPLPRGSVHIAVTFALDSDGILNVHASEANTGKATAARLRLVGLPDAREVASMTQRHTAQQSL